MRRSLEGAIELRSIRSTSHPLVRRVRGLLRDARLREEDGCFIAEGVRLCLDALEAEAPVEHALLAEGMRSLMAESSAGAARRNRLTKDERLSALCDLLRRRRVPVSFLPGRVLAACQDADAPQGVALVVGMCRASLASALAPGENRLVTIAWQVQEPGNLGAIARTAEGAGSNALVTVKGGADPHHPRAVRGSAGSVFRLPIVRGADAATLPASLREHGFTIAAGVARGGEPYDSADLTGPLALIVGNEGAGLPSEIDPFIDRRVTIPMRGRVESLNVAVSAGILLFESARQRRGRG